MPDEDIFDDDKVEDKDDLLDQTKGEGDDDKGDEETVDQLLQGITNEDGTPKYKTEAEAIKALKHAQDHIKQIEADNANLKDKGNASDKLDELLDAVKQSKGSGQGNEDDASTMKPEDVLGIVKEYLDDSKAAETRSGNIKTVTTAFKDRYGKEASKELYGKAEDLGLSRKEINGMIANNPTAALKVLGVEAKAPNKADPTTLQSGVGTAPFQGKPESKPTSAMGLSSSKDLVDTWNASKERTLKRLGIES